jgi:hypothetical protein
MSNAAEFLISDVETWKQSLEAGLRKCEADRNSKLDMLLEHTKNVETVFLGQLKNTLFDLSESQYWEFSSREVGWRPRVSLSANGLWDSQCFRIVELIIGLDHFGENRFFCFGCVS